MLPVSRLPHLRQHLGHLHTAINIVKSLKINNLNRFRSIKGPTFGPKLLANWLILLHGYAIIPRTKANRPSARHLETLQSRWTFCSPGGLADHQVASHPRGKCWTLLLDREESSLVDVGTDLKTHRQAASKKSLAATPGPTLSPQHPRHRHLQKLRAHGGRDNHRLRLGAVPGGSDEPQGMTDSPQEQKKPTPQLFTCDRQSAIPSGKDGKL